MVWNYFVLFALVSIFLWGLSVFVMFWKPKMEHNQIPFWLSVFGTAILAGFILFYWIDIQRPPMRTMAETRIWYSFLVSLVSIFVYRTYKSKAMFSLGLCMASVFLIVDILHPEYHGKYLMPALQSAWFIPHVVVYMVAYALLASASISASAGLFGKTDTHTHITQAMLLVYPGFALLTVGMLLGAFWAKFAWGSYWAWDPKETWALITWLFYLVVIHIHQYFPNRMVLLSRLLVVSFVVLLVTWLGIKYLPSASQSVHVYGG